MLLFLSGWWRENNIYYEGQRPSYWKLSPYCMTESLIVSINWHNFRKDKLLTNRLLPDHRNMCWKKSLVAKYYFVIDKTVLRNCKWRGTKMCWSELTLRKLIMFSHSWILKYLQMSGVAKNIIKKTKFALWSVCILKVIFLADFFSLVFMLSILPLSF